MNKSRPADIANSPAASRILPDLSQKAIPMTDSKSSPTSRKRGNRVIIEFLDSAMNKHHTPPADILAVNCIAVETGWSTLVTLADLSPTITLQLAALGLSLLARNSGNTADDAESARDTMEARIGAIVSGSYYASGRTAGTPLVFRAMQILMTRLRDAMPLDDPRRLSDDAIAIAVNNRLIDWRGEGKFDDLDSEAAAKALKKHRKAVSDRYESLSGMAEIMADLRAAKPVTVIDAASELF
jgi:hypothetical protein